MKYFGYWFAFVCLGLIRGRGGGVCGRVKMKEQFSKQELMEHLLETMIANLGYPVGMGIAPHPDATKKMAEFALKLAMNTPPADSR